MGFGTLSFLLPLVLVSLARAGDTVCPAGYEPRVITTTITRSQIISNSVPPSEASYATSLPDPVLGLLNANTTAPSPSQLSGSTTSLSDHASTTSFVSSESVAVGPTASSASADAGPTSSAEKFIGMGTRYGSGCTEEDCWQNGACSFVDYTLPPGIDGSTCVSADIWENGGNCGGCISVSYKGKAIIVMVRIH